MTNLKPVDVAIIERTGCVSFASAIDSVSFNEMAIKRNLTKVYKNAYLFAVQDCISCVCHWCMNKQMRDPAEYILEAGDPKQGLLTEVMKIYNLPEPIFRRKIDKDPLRSILPLQAADFLAYEVSRGHAAILAKKELRYPLKEFMRMHYSENWGVHRKDDIEIFLSSSENARRLEALLGKWDGPVTLD